MKEKSNQFKNICAGDLVQIDWTDASIGKSLSNGIDGIDVPVKSWGVFVGVLGQKRKHVILAQNAFRYSDGLYDIDYTAVPVSWATSATVLSKGHVGEEEARVLLNSFTLNEKVKSEKSSFGRCRRQKRVRNHD